jgi:hypothetical protein
MSFGISLSNVFSILHHHLSVRKVSWVPRVSPNLELMIRLAYGSDLELTNEAIFYF